MESSHHPLLVAGLLATLLPAVAADFRPQLGSPCEPTLLATQVALSCALNMPTAPCYEPVVAAVDLGGGVPCLCRVAAEPQLVMAGFNASHLLTIYISCGGLPLGVVHLAAACEGPAPPGALVSSPPPLPHSHVPRRNQPAAGMCPSASNLATAVAIYCWDQVPKDSCCLALRAAVSDFDAPTCLCTLVEDKAVKEMGLPIRHLVKMYTSCMGFRPGDVHLPAAGCKQHRCAEMLSRISDLSPKPNI